MDVESYRTKEGLTYRELGLRLGLGIAVSQMRRIALGEIWPRPGVIDAIVEHSGRIVTVEAMHRRYSAQHSAAA